MVTRYENIWTMLSPVSGRWLGMKRPKLRSAAEYDTVCDRGSYSYLQQAGATSNIKRRIRRRERRLGKEDLRVND